MKGELSYSNLNQSLKLSGRFIHIIDFSTQQNFYEILLIIKMKVLCSYVISSAIADSYLIPLQENTT